MEQKGFGGHKTTLYNSTMVDRCHYLFDQLTEMYADKSEPKCNLWTLGDKDVSV